MFSLSRKNLKKITLSLFVVSNLLVAKTTTKKASKKAVKTVSPQTKKPSLNHETFVDLLINQLPQKISNGFLKDLNQSFIEFSGDLISRYSAIPSSINWTLFIEKQKALYPIADTSLPKFYEIMFQSNFKAKVLEVNKNISSTDFEALYFTYRFYLASLNTNLSLLAKGKSFVSIDQARDAFIKARTLAVETFNRHKRNQEIIKFLSLSSIYLLGDFLIPTNPVQVASREIGLLHSESLVKLDHEQNYAFEIYQYSPKKVRSMSFKKFQLVGLESACALYYRAENKKYLVLAKDILSPSKELPALEYNKGKLSYIRKIAKTALGKRESITSEEAALFKDERLKLLPFYRTDFDEKRKSRIEAAQESATDSKFVDSILGKLNNGKSLSEVSAEKTNGLESARKRLYTVFNKDGSVDEKLSEETRRAYEKALRDATQRTKIPAITIETSLFLESSFDLLSENIKEKRERKGIFKITGDVWGNGLAQLSPAEALMPLEKFYNFQNEEVSKINSQPIAYGELSNITQTNDENSNIVLELINTGVLTKDDFIIPEYIQEFEKILASNNWKRLNAEQLKVLDELEDVRKRSILQIQRWIREAENSPRSVWSPYYAIQRFADHLAAIQKQDYSLVGNRKAGPYLFGDQYSTRVSDQMRSILAIYNRGQGYLTNSLEFQRIYNGGVLIPGNYYYTWAAGRGKTPEEKLSMIQAQWEKDRYFVLPKALDLREKPTQNKPTLETQFINLRHIIYGIGLSDQPNENSVYGILKKLFH